MLRRTYQFVMKLAESRHAVPALAAVAFAESSFFPLPPDALLIPMCLARPQRALAYAGLCTLASVLGGMLGYYIGAALYATIGTWLIDTYHLQHAFDMFVQQYAKYGVWVILLKGLTPIPYKLVTISAGIAHFPFWVFVGLSVLSRGPRFFISAILLRIYGDRARDFIERRLVLLTTAFAALLVGGVLALKFL